MVKNAFVVVGLAIACAIASAACKQSARGSAPAAEGKGWSVLKDGKVVEWIDDKPGPMFSRAAPPPPGTPLTTNPFMRATSKDVMSEGALENIQEQSTSFADYVARLKKSGYVVRPAADDD